MLVIVKNKKAYFDYEILDEVTCWLLLFGHEVKSVKLKHVSMNWCYAQINKWELFITWLRISQYNHATDIEWYDPIRKRKLLATRSQISRLEWKLTEKWLTLVPTLIWIDKNKVKINIWLCKWKKQYEKKEIIKNRQIDREIKRNFKW